MNDMKQLEELLHKLLDSELNETEQAQLDKILQESPEAREYYNDYIDNHVALDWHFAANSLDLPSGLEPLIEQSSKKPKPVIPFIIGIAAAIALALFIIRKPKEKIETVKVQNEAIFTLNKVVSADWKAPIKKGHEFKAGKLFLKSGYSELASDDGSKLVIEGPAEIELISKDELRINQGKLVSNSKSPIKIHTPRTKLTSVSETAIKVADNGDTEILALSGDIQIDNGKISESQGRMLTKNSSKEAISEPDDFMRILPDNSEELKHIHWGFNEGQGMVTHYTGENLKDKDYDAYLKSTFNGKPGPKWINGKFGKALEFDGNGGYLETGFPGIGGSSARTVAFWVKVPEFAPLNQSKFVSWGSYEGKGHTWQISWNWNEKNGKIGALRAGIFHGQIVGSRDLRDNQWHHIAVVMFGGEQANVSTHILLYIDGKLEKASKKSILGVKTDIKSRKSTKVLLGRDAQAYILKNKPENVFKGSMDEVYIFNSALSESQIRQIMENNSPPSY